MHARPVAARLVTKRCPKGPCARGVASSGAAANSFVRKGGGRRWPRAPASQPPVRPTGWRKAVQSLSIHTTLGAPGGGHPPQPHHTTSRPHTLGKISAPQRTAPGILPKRLVGARAAHCGSYARFLGATAHAPLARVCSTETEAPTRHLLLFHLAVHTAFTQQPPPDRLCCPPHWLLGSLLLAPLQAAAWRAAWRRLLHRGNLPSLPLLSAEHTAPVLRTPWRVHICRVVPVQSWPVASDLTLSWS